MKKVVIYGATSAIAQSIAEIYAIEKAELLLIALEEDKLISIKRNLEVKYNVIVNTLTHNAFNLDTIQETIHKAIDIIGFMDVFIVAHGILPDQKRAENDLIYAFDTHMINANSVMALCLEAANFFEVKGSGTICVISSVAGDRGRQSNYIYGAAKGAVSIFLSGLRNRMYPKNVNVLTIKPGFVDSPMTEHLQKGLLFSSPLKIATCIKSAIDKKKSVAYTPFYWGIIMFIVIHIPESIFKRLKM